MKSIFTCLYFIESSNLLLKEVVKEICGSLDCLLINSLIFLPKID